MTCQWWERRKDNFDLYISDFVIEEAEGGDIDAAKRRLNLLDGIEILAIDDETIRIFKMLMDTGIFPEKAKVDAGHISVASRHGMDFLLTWNCSHIANAELIRKISFFVHEAGYDIPVICTPNELFGSEEHNG